ncbi:MAG: helix-turn-helix domain-containing protein, partial [Chloroflexota bacterium]
MTDYTVGVLEDAIKILNTLRDHNTGLTLSEITDTSGFVKNKVFRLLYTLEKNQMVDRDSNGLYHMGIQMITYAQTVEHKNWLMVASHEVMDWLVDVTGETIF